MRQLQIRVFLTLETRREQKVLFERVVDLTDGLDVPFSRLLESLKFMYGLSSIIEFAVL